MLIGRWEECRKRASVAFQWWIPPSMDGVAIVGEASDEMYGGNHGGAFHPWESLLSMDGEYP